MRPVDGEQADRRRRTWEWRPGSLPPDAARTFDSRAAVLPVEPRTAHPRRNDAAAPRAHSTETPRPREQQRRHELLQQLLDEHSLDALVLVGNDYRGHKGPLRWVADFNLSHRHGFALVVPGRCPELILPSNLMQGPPPGWDVPIRHARRAAEGVAEALGELRRRNVVGVVGMDEIMRVGDLELLRRTHPGTRFIDVTQAFEVLRAHKSVEELAGIRQATSIAERCFQRLLELARPGMTERQIAAELYGTMYALGGEDPLFLSMSGERGPDGRTQPRWGPPRDRILQVGDQLIISFELIGPLGYWTELARMIVFGPPSPSQLRLNAGAAAGLQAAARALVPGARPEAVQRALVDAVESHGALTTYWSGHGLGQDVIEEPWIGREIVDEATAGDWTLAERMVLAVHPKIVDKEGSGMAYMSNVYIVTGAGGAPVSELSLDIYVL